MKVILAVLKRKDQKLLSLPFDLAIPLLELYPKNPETPIQRNLCTPIYNSQVLDAT